MRKKPFSGNFVGALIWWLLSAAWVMVLFYFSGQNGADSSQLSGNLARWLLDRPACGSFEGDILRHTMPSGVCSYCVGEQRVGSAFQQGVVGKINFEEAEVCSL